ncbi:probable G-protein coupled receptor No18 [Apostichopus japonicus]|uniref:probable G-protein coupled receptor No18 n=1 Tax=Stichopus japonicus TaxID=307972 RepID=UPI003AB6560A
MMNTTIRSDSVTSDDRESFPVDTAISALLLTQLLVGLLGIVGNFLVCFVFLHRRTQRNQTNLLITNQAFIDLFTSLLLVLHVVYELSGHPETDIYLLRIWSCFLWKNQNLLFASFAISTFNLTIISLERYFATIFPHSYANIFTRRNLRFTILVIWLVSPLMQYILIITTIRFSDETGCDIRWTPAWVGILLFLWEYFLPVIIMSFSFASVARKLRRMNKVLSNASSLRSAATMTTAAVESRSVVTEATASCEQGVETSFTQGTVTTSMFLKLPMSARNRQDCFHSQQENTPPSATPTPSPAASFSSPSTSNFRVNVRRRNATTTLLTVYFVYIICWSPNQWAFFQLNLGGPLDFRGYFYKISVTLVILNTCVNPFIYALRHKTYKDRVKELVRHCKRKIGVH